MVAIHDDELAQPLEEAASIDGFDRFENRREVVLAGTLKLEVGQQPGVVGNEGSWLN